MNASIVPPKDTYLAVRVVCRPYMRLCIRGAVAAMLGVVLLQVGVRFADIEFGFSVSIASGAFGCGALLCILAAAVLRRFEQPREVVSYIGRGSRLPVIHFRRR
jgi:hypothetical protein